MEGVYIFLADGFEDMEAIATRDVLLRGGVDVQTVSINEDPAVFSETISLFPYSSVNLRMISATPVTL